MSILFDNIGKQASKSPHSVWVIIILMAYKMISPHLLELRHIDRNRGLAPRAAKLVVSGTSLNSKIKSLKIRKTRFTTA
jgi:hypothetical protein